MANNNTPPSKRERTRIRVIGTAAVRSDAITSVKVRNSQRRSETTTIDIRYCASHRGVMHSAEEVGGVCRVCEQLVCTECAKHTCALCGEIVCLKESIQTEHGDICSNHGFWETLIFTFRGGRNGKKV